MKLEKRTTSSHHHINVPPVESPKDVLSTKGGIIGRKNFAHAETTETSNDAWIF